MKIPEKLKLEQEQTETGPKCFMSSTVRTCKPAHFQYFYIKNT